MEGQVHGTVFDQIYARHGLDASTSAIQTLNVRVMQARHHHCVFPGGKSVWDANSEYHRSQLLCRRSPRLSQAMGLSSV